MTRIIITVALLLMLAGCSTNQLYYTAQTLTAVDASQTLYIAQNPSDYHETNVILGRHPSEEAVTAYFAAGMLTNWAINKYAPEWAKYTAFIGVIGVESACVINNHKLGIGLAIPFR